MFKDVVGADDLRMQRMLLESAFFLDPRAVARTPVMFPGFVRESKEHHSGKSKGDTSEWNGLPVRVFDNTKARDAFARYSGRVLNGKGRTVSLGFEVAHIWGRVYDPEYFTAGWNMCLLPSFLRPFVEEQAQEMVLADLLRQAAFDLYLRAGPARQPSTPVSPPSPTLDLASRFEGWKPTVIV